MRAHTAAQVDCVNWQHPRRLETRTYRTSLENGNVLAGGIRHLAIGRLPDGQARLVSSEVSAELWTFSRNTTSGNYVFLSRMFAAPTAADVSQPSINGAVGSGFAFGGITPASFARQWQLTPPILEANVDTDYSELGINITMVRSNPSFQGTRKGCPSRPS